MPYQVYFNISVANQGFLSVVLLFFPIFFRNPRVIFFPFPLWFTFWFLLLGTDSSPNIWICNILFIYWLIHCNASFIILLTNYFIWLNWKSIGEIKSWWCFLSNCFFGRCVYWYISIAYLMLNSVICSHLSYTTYNYKTPSFLFMASPNILSIALVF